MKKTRYLPYGYTCRNGKTTVERTEAETIRHIFDRYIDGASLGELAEELTQKNIPYRTSNASAMLNAKTIQRKISAMKVQSAFRPEYFKELIEYLTLGDHGEVTLHTKANTIITERSKNE